MSKALELMNEAEDHWRSTSSGGHAIPIEDDRSYQALRAEVERLEERAEWLEAQVEAAKRMDVEIEARALERWAKTKRGHSMLTTAQADVGYHRALDDAEREAARIRAEAQGEQE